jgi:hypothetical protein
MKISGRRRRNMSPPSSESKNKPSKKTTVKQVEIMSSKKT